jgi:23S rRNA (uridine2552-2'-O)-methyltransferase
MTRFVAKDTFFNKAKQDGFRARSAYKLKEAQEKYGLIRKGDRVLDIGCAPGSFLQVIARLIGDQGKAAGIDILPIDPLPFKNITAVKADIRDLDILAMLHELSLTHFDVITCDIAPNLSGIREADEKNVNELFEAVLKVVKDGLKAKGNFLMKSFFSDSFKQTEKALRDIFGKVTVFKPASSRSVSSEIFFVCTGRK